ncbi:MAG: hypothetical protein ACOCV2_15130 [Persicimonas sp.]
MGIEDLTTWPAYYIATWALFCAFALVYWVVHRRDFEWAWPSYWRFLLAPWRLTFFVLAFIGINVMAPYTGDPTWDYVDASFMAILAYTTAPACVAIIYGVARRARPRGHLLVAVAIWLFSASWSYDIYLFFRDGAYPSTWSANITASSFLYLSAGAFWTLDWQPDRGVYWAFRDQKTWPQEPASGAGLEVMRVGWMFLVPVVFFFLIFLVPPLRDAAVWMANTLSP